MNGNDYAVELEEAREILNSLRKAYKGACGRQGHDQAVQNQRPRNGVFQPCRFIEADTVLAAGNYAAGSGGGYFPAPFRPYHHAILG